MLGLYAKNSGQILIVAHRLNTLRKADAIYRIEDNLLEPCGLPDEIE